MIYFVYIELNKNISNLLFIENGNFYLYFFSNRVIIKFYMIIIEFVNNIIWNLFNDYFG